MTIDIYHARPLATMPRGERHLIARWALNRHQRFVVQSSVGHIEARNDYPTDLADDEVVWATTFVAGYATLYFCMPINTRKPTNDLCRL